MTDVYTENLAEFGIREIEMLKDILVAWVENGLPDNFSKDGVRPAMNKNSGHVFLVNEAKRLIPVLLENRHEVYVVCVMSGDLTLKFTTATSAQWLKSTSLRLILFGISRGY